MGYPALHKEVAAMIGQAKRLVTWFGKAERWGLLPALTALQSLTAQPGRRIPVPGVPAWQEECELLGITPEVVRQWRCRTQAEKDIRQMMGELPPRPHRSSPNQLEHYKQRLKLVVNKILTDDELDTDDELYRMAAHIAEEEEW